MKKISEMTVDVGVDIIIKEQTARLAVDVLNLYLKSNPDKIPVLDKTHIYVLFLRKPFHQCK